MNFKSFLNINKLFEAYDYHADDGADDADKWLAKWTYEGLDKYPHKEVLDELVEKYPFDGGVVYRGLNFHDKEQYDKFIENTNGGTLLHTGSITSWTQDEKTTYPFAVTRPTYFLNRELMQAEDKKNRERDFMIGHAGLVLETIVKPGKGIDVNKSKYGKESEIILVPGTYEIKIHKQYIPFMRSINDENFKKKFMSINTISEREDDHQAKMFNHIMFHYKEFDDEMKHHLFGLLVKNVTKIQYGVEVTEAADWNDSKWPKIEVYWNVPPTFFIYYSMLLPEDAKIIDDQLDQVIESIERDFDEKTKGIDFAHKFELDINNSIALAIKMEHLENKLTFMQKMRQNVGKRYNELNSYEAVKKINAIKDPAKQLDAIKKLAKDLEQALKQGKF